MNRIGIAAATLIVAVGFAGARGGGLLQQAPAAAARVKNPFETEKDAQAAGAKLYARECASCHGSSGQGRGDAPPLDRPEVYGAPAGALFWALRHGSLHRGMPSFAHLPEAQRWQIITFLQSNPGR